MYVNAVKEKKVFELPPRSLPWSNQTIREQELVKVIGIKYEIKPPRLCCLKVNNVANYLLLSIYDINNK